MEADILVQRAFSLDSSLALRTCDDFAALRVSSASWAHVVLSSARIEL
jgi:hypothetical protein